jgi:nucleotide-binding universal stress UspA family protein
MDQSSPEQGTPDERRPERRRQQDRLRPEPIRHEAQPRPMSLAHPVDASGLEVHVRTRRGSPARELASIAAEFSADALVIGAPRHFWHHLIGSVPSWLARNARCPVIVVP